MFKPVQSTGWVVTMDSAEEEAQNDPLFSAIYQSKCFRNPEDFQTRYIDRDPKVSIHPEHISYSNQCMPEATGPLKKSGALKYAFLKKRIRTGQKAAIAKVGELYGLIESNPNASCDGVGGNPMEEACQIASSPRNQSTAPELEFHCNAYTSCLKTDSSQRNYHEQYDEHLNDAKLWQQAKNEFKAEKEKMQEAIRHPSSPEAAEMKEKFTRQCERIPETDTENDYHRWCHGYYDEKKKKDIPGFLSRIKTLEYYQNKKSGTMEGLDHAQVNMDAILKDRLVHLEREEKSVLEALSQNTPWVNSDEYKSGDSVADGLNKGICAELAAAIREIREYDGAIKCMDPEIKSHTMGQKEKGKFNCTMDNLNNIAAKAAPPIKLDPYENGLCEQIASEVGASCDIDQCYKEVRQQDDLLHYAKGMGKAKAQAVEAYEMIGEELLFTVATMGAGAAANLAVKAAQGARAASAARKAQQAKKAYELAMAAKKAGKKVNDIKKLEQAYKEAKAASKIFDNARDAEKALRTATDKYADAQKNLTRLRKAGATAEEISAAVKQLRNANKLVRGASETAKHSGDLAKMARLEKLATRGSKIITTAAETTEDIISAYRTVRDLKDSCTGVEDSVKDTVVKKADYGGPACSGGQPGLTKKITQAAKGCSTIEMLLGAQALGGIGLKYLSKIGKKASKNISEIASKRLAKAKDAVGEAADALESAKRKIDSAKAKLKNAQDKAADIKNKLKNATTQEAKEKLQKELDEIREEVARQQSRLDEASDAFKTASRNKKDIEKKIADMEQAIKNKGETAKLVEEAKKHKEASSALADEHLRKSMRDSMKETAKFALDNKENLYKGVVAIEKITTGTDYSATVWTVSSNAVDPTNGKSMDMSTRLTSTGLGYVETKNANGETVSVIFDMNKGNFKYKDGSAKLSRSEFNVIVNNFKEIEREAAQATQYVSVLNSTVKSKNKFRSVASSTLDNIKKISETMDNFENDDRFRSESNSAGR